MKKEAVGSVPVLWVRGRGQGGCSPQLLGDGSCLAPSPLRASLQPAGEGDAVQEEREAWFNAALPAWRFHYFHLVFFSQYVSVAARGMSFPGCFQGKSSFSSLPPLLWVSFQSVFPWAPLSLSRQRQECFPEAGQRLMASW